MNANVTLESRFVLDPDFRLKPDVDRAVVITRPPPLAERELILALLHPTEALIISLMDGRRTVQAVGDLWAELSDKPRPSAYRDVAEVMDHVASWEGGREQLLRDVHSVEPSRICIYDPMDFVIPADTVNLEDRRLRLPYHIYYLPTLYCPQRCVYCYAKTSLRPESNLVRVERLREIFVELRSIGVEVIQMSGGEVFARPDIFEVLEAILDAQLVPDIPTKFGLSEQMTLRLKDLGVKTVQFSLDSADPEIVAYMVGLPNYPSRAFDALENLKRAGLAVRTNSVLTPANVSGISRLLEYLGRLGNVYKAALTPYGRSLIRHRDNLFVDEATLQRLGDEIAAVQARYPHMRITLGGNGAEPPTNEEEQRLSWERRGFCSGNRNGLVILPDGRVTVCEELYDHPAFIIGDVTRQSVMEVWRSPEAMALLNPEQAAVPDGACKSCDEFSKCNAVRGRCWRDVLKSYGWERPHWPDPRCPRAPLGNRLG